MSVDPDQTISRIGHTPLAAQTVQGASGAVPVPVNPGAVASTSVTRVAASASSTTLLAANSSRLFFFVVNDSTASLKIKYGATASSTSFTLILPAGQWMSDTLYKGQIDGIWDSATGAAQLTEG